MINIEHGEPHLNHLKSLLAVFYLPYWSLYFSQLVKLFRRTSCYAEASLVTFFLLYSATLLPLPRFLWM